MLTTVIVVIDSSRAGQVRATQSCTICFFLFWAISVLVGVKFELYDDKLDETHKNDKELKSK